MTVETLSGATSSEIVWDAASRGTAFTGAGHPINVAGLDGWSPEVILATSVAASIMTRFLSLAATAHLEVLGYVSRQRAVLAGAADAPDIEVSPCIVVTSEQAAARARTLLDSAVSEAPAVRALRRAPMVDPRYTVVRDPRDVVKTPGWRPRP
jgi:hypothetical protein